MPFGDEYVLEGVVESAAPQERSGRERYQEAGSAGVLDEAADIADRYRVWREAGVSLVEDAEIQRARTTRRLFSAAENAVADLEYTAEEVYTFAEQTDLEWKDGVYLSAVCERAPGETVRLPALPDLMMVGAFNTKQLFIEGETGAHLGYRMRGGRIIASGDTANHLGQEMEAGHIHLYGDAERHVAVSMSGGSIRVAGDTGTMLGNGMAGGYACVMGDAGEDCGRVLNGGRIEVQGQVDGVVGSDLIDGRIVLHTDAVVAPDAAEQGDIRVRGDAV